LIGQLGKEVVNNLVFLDGKREEVDFFNRLDLVSLDETTELGDRNPFVLFFTTTSAASTTTTSTSTSKTTTSC
jgi:hypothetical protein